MLLKKYITKDRAQKSMSSKMGLPLRLTALPMLPALPALPASATLMALATLTTLATLATLPTANAQAPNMRDALEERQKLADAIEELDEKGEENNVASARMYNQLLTFRYSPSQRDPFISSVVISPFVTEDETPLEMPADMEQVDRARKLIISVVKRRIDITGVAYGKVGSSYTIAYSDPERSNAQILRPGDYIVIEMSPEEQQAIDGAYKLAAEAGVKLNLQVASNKPALMLRVLAIDGSTMEIESPGGDGSFTVSYKKQLEVDDKPRPAQVE